MIWRTLPRLRMSAMLLTLLCCFLRPASAFWAITNVNQGLVVERLDPIVSPNSISGHAHKYVMPEGIMAELMSFLR